MISDSESEISNQEAEEALSRCISQVRKNISTFSACSQNHSSVHNFYPSCENTHWTCGFWPGELWIAFYLTGEECFRSAALQQCASMENRIAHKIAVDHHDMGFLYSPSCVAAWKLTGDAAARDAAIAAADQLLSRWQPKGQFLQAWGSMDAADSYRFIIDCLLNTPLLYWAAQETGSSMYAERALAHTKTCMAHAIRPDGSTFHTFFMNPQDGSPLRGRTCQGYADDSAWARGQAWGIYGSALACRYDYKPEYKAAFERTSAFFISRLPGDNVPYWDLIFNDGNALHDGVQEPRDSSAAAIAACGFLEMAALTKDRSLEHTARVLLKSLAERYAVRDSTQSNGLLLHGTYSKHSPYNTCTEEGVDECVSWGDFFYMEALTRVLNPSWHSFW